MLEDMLDRVYNEQIRKTEKTISKRLDKINEVSGLNYNNNVANWILIDFLTLDIEHPQASFASCWQSLSFNDLRKENPKALIYQLKNALKLLCEKNILKKVLEDADYYSLNDEYMRENKIWDIVE
ncbi:hypothetical protein [Brachyspira catarrhinii]|uniref:Uncharacterized protein n=1 Tax=Brachyspira catarrhinii TaxID=2528966 RepID=A0ABY2TVG7_9SPIR|nr:hypothetical protein [Brachyspira catarrhinii]TKZ36056.1 hypothetical protein EZH24_01990 [Brachyspira catarrhinii]